LSTSSGLADNPAELRQWLNRVEIRLSRLGSGNLDGVAAGYTQQSNTAPQVTGVSLVSNLNTITVRWNAVPIINLDFYEIQVDQYPSFPNPLVQRQRNLQYTYEDGSPGGEYYVRIRAKAIGGGYGWWSGTLDTSTGRATVNHLNRGSATTLTDNERDLTGYQTLDPNGLGVPGTMVSDDYPGTVVKVEGGTILPFASFEYQVASKWLWGSPGTSYLKVELKRLGPTGVVTVDVSDTDYAVPSYGDYATATMGDAAVLGLGTPDDPGYGVFEYFLTASVEDDPGVGAYIMVKPIACNLEIVELRS
jgi:hypothetical protein